MAIPRLAPDTNPLSIEITINERLRPYFTLWYQREKKGSETPEQFAIRQMKGLAIRSYTRMIEMESIQESNLAEIQAREESKQARQEFIDDSILIGQEVE